MLVRHFGRLIGPLANPSRRRATGRTPIRAPESAGGTHNGTGRFRRIVRAELLEPRRDEVDGNPEQHDERAGKQVPEHSIVHPFTRRDVERA